MSMINNVSPLGNADITRNMTETWMTRLDRSGGPGNVSERAYSIVKGCDDISSIVGNLVIGIICVRHAEQACA
ncbi:hypothetical protein CY34DRAFT_557367 [Suillus luteus UH-Slu-Lm8-n1]|uniref:Uncharacterized protein n=1 Tax=Suillus luteus UH-Slu-Lm8-n1 TaxID=930992 RepID=A0A0D0AVD1_9AGAM|nr:hypothetical protein CY34DRAFT_557367 [Suillus luteus UH-Slu-Lm8-n1]